ncbi:hypothetical protein B7P43_G08433 [Cryptotermes secundus]|uniref:Uncharacterized protein n=1 Tax=Cryptotermes secundus TaxID=105785 RepID=A0A2J7PZQ5_9NEOP|nr:hypothetical protein B7P43_G08433 [Cryptotermes secundus]
MRTARVVVALLLLFKGVACAPLGVIEVLRNFWDLLVAPEATRAIHNVPFDPDAAISFRSNYQNSFGYRGMHLVEMLGKGYTREQLVELRAVTP